MPHACAPASGKGSARRALPACIAAILAPLALLLPPTTAHADDDLCGEPKASPKDVYARVSKDSRVREMHRNDIYVGLENGTDGTLWTFTLDKHPAHPAVICRRVVERRGVIDIPTTIVCDGPKAACAELKTDFDALNARMIYDLYKLPSKAPEKGK